MRRVAVLVAIVLAILAAPLAATAQTPGKIPRIGFLGLITWGAPYYEAFWKAMRELGYVEYKTSPSSGAMREGILSCSTIRWPNWPV